MTIQEAYQAVLRKEHIDRIPVFCWYPQLPRGAFEREMRQRGMGLVTHANVFMPTADLVKHSTYDTPDGVAHTYSTPVGDISELLFLPSGRVANPDMWLTRESLCQTAENLKVWTWIVQHTGYRLNDAAFDDQALDLGADGVVKLYGCSDPDMAIKDRIGLFDWSLLQYDAEEEMDALLDALARSAQQQCDLLCESKRYRGVSITLSSFDDSVSPARYTEKSFPVLQSIIRQLQEAGLLCGVHAHGSRLKGYAEMVPALHYDFVESYTPPPYSDLPLHEARRIWGKDTVIQVNFPESVFYEGFQGVREYTTRLLKEDPNGLLMIGFTEMGMTGVSRQNYSLFADGFRAIMDAVEAAR